MGTAAWRLSSLHLVLVLTLGVACSSRSAGPAEAGGGGTNMYARWTNGPPRGEDFFPIAVWLQDPANAANYKAAGINLYVGLWQGPTEGQLAALQAAGMQVVCHQNEVGLRHAGEGTIVGWMHGDEPDNAQSLGEGKGWGPPIPAAQIIADYERLKERDPSRPVLLNLGQGVAWDGWYGRGVRTNHPEDYVEYVKGADVVSFDIYPMAHPNAAVAGQLWYVAQGVARLRAWAAPEQPVWNCIECTRINEPVRKATPHQVKAEVWMSLVHGSTGLIYFVHEWQPVFNEDALLDDPEMLAAVTAINQQIDALAPALNAPTVYDGVQVESAAAEMPVAAMVKVHGGYTYLFAVGMRDGSTRATFTLPDRPANARAEVLGEERAIAVSDGRLADDFGPYDVHLYRIR
ncbi:MAG: hypothetical protein AB1505_13430 [Candidatus Latescibacterota bacterium]